MTFVYKFFFILVGLLIVSCNSDVPSSVSTFKKANQSIKLDGIIDNVWSDAEWVTIDHKWIGPDYTPEDFTGRYKCLWDSGYIYFLAEIKDDILLDNIDDPLVNYWDDDCLEIFIDEDRSKGLHQYTHNAFAYHIALNGMVTDIGTDQKPQLYSHVKCSRKSTKKTNITIWEGKIEVYSDAYLDNGNNQSIKLSTNKKIGFAMAYCDNDTSKERENFIGSVPVKGDDKNRGWIDAGIFGEVTLVE